MRKSINRLCKIVQSSFHLEIKVIEHVQHIYSCRNCENNLKPQVYLQYIFEQVQLVVNADTPSLLAELENIPQYFKLK